MKDEDRTLLERYGRERCEPAFAELVRRHIDMVWGTARRVTGDSDLARDVAQGVFTDLARKARFFPAAASVPGWLYRATTLAARNAVRANLRRTRREREAMEIHLPELSSAGTVERLMPLLDEGLQTLPEKDREAVVLRFFARKSLAEIGTAFAISEDAAQKRVARALERLRIFFDGQGQAVPPGVVLAALTTAGTSGAPAGIATAVAGASCAAAGSAGVTGAVVSFLTGTGEQIILMKTKIMVASLAAVAVGTPLVVQQRTLAGWERDRAEIVAAAREIEALRAEHAGLAHQRQLQADWQQQEGDRAEFARMREEAGRLRAAAGLNPDLQSQLAEARKNYEIAKAEVNLANETIQMEQLQEHTISAMKNLGLAARIYSMNNGDRYPGAFDDIKEEIGPKLSGDLALDRFEFVAHEREISEREPQLLLFREKEARRMANGKWARAYTFADGSVQQQESDTPDFSAWEKNLIARQQEQASR